MVGLISGTIMIRRLFLILFTTILTSCASMKPSDFSDGRPLFDPATFFTGHAKSFGVLENRAGTPKQRVRTETSGKWAGASLELEQDLIFGDGKRQHRSWRIRRVDAHHYEATANDVIGTIHGESFGNVFHWSFKLALSPGNPLGNVRMSQWMYLQPDGQTMINHSTISKLGVVVAQVTEQFRRGVETDHSDRR